MSDVSIRFATPDDAESVFRLVQQLAEYEKLAHEVISSPEVFRNVLAQPESTVEVLLAELSGRAIGFALFFENFSTFLGQPGLYLEDLFVLPEMRRTETMAGLSGRCWIGTHQRSSSTRRN